MRFLITGITGFVGPHLARLLLNEKHEIWGLIRCSNGRELDLLDVLSPDELKSIKWIFCDLTNFCSVNRMLRENQFEGIFHLAAQSHVVHSFTQPILTFNTNLMGTVNLISGIMQNQPECRFHFCSTSEVYGNAGRNVQTLSEEIPLAPCNPYGVSKAAADMYVQERIGNHFLNGFITRAFSHTGPRRGFNFSISSDAYQIAKMLKGIQDKKLLVGNLKTKRVVMDVRDCVKAYYSLMMSKEKGVFNVGGSDVHEMQYYTDLLISLSGLEGIVQEIYEPFWRPMDIEVQICNNRKIENAIGWKSIIPIEETLMELLFYWIKKLERKNYV